MSAAIRFACFGLMFAMLASPAFAQKTIGPDAGAKIRGEVTSSAVNQHYAQETARVMYYAQQINPGAAPEVIQKQAETVKTALAKSDESLKAVKEANAKDPEVVTLVDSILKHHASAVAHCNMAAECAVKKEGGEIIADCCAEMHDELEAAKKDMKSLKKHLKVEELPVPKKAAKKA
jgi:hypothetical protein